ncbi:DMT family transporter [Marinomonas foliarum]|uniref:DMT family transporter n=1 Tax=Marinomonas foliarum TaxID=491950 RepID=A0A369AIC9_9GAMM|nr:DMT family transporter [Marinomonas foliarum]QRV23185.1 DMT family transporter [Marinomonas foliarum]RCX08865.1 EamA domain-containing membrane protein RarD [Marinomonas foliarum]
MSKLSHNAQAMIFGLGAVLLWSTVATAFSISLRHFSPTQLLLVANVVSLFFLASLLVIKGEFGSLMSYAKQSWKSSLFFGAINPFLYYLILLQAYNTLPAQEAQVINYTWAITLSFMAVPILKQRLKTADYMAAAACYFGVLYIATRGQIGSLEFSNASGVSFALVSTIIWALYWLLNTKDKRPSLVGLTLNFVFALPLIFIYAALTGELTHWDNNGLWGAIYIGLFEMGLSFVLWNKALKLTSNASQVANLIFLSPLLSIVWLSQFAGEPILHSTLVGLACILIGLFIQNWAKRKTK